MKKAIKALVMAMAATFCLTGTTQIYAGEKQPAAEKETGELSELEKSGIQMDVVVEKDADGNVIGYKTTIRETDPLTGTVTEKVIVSDLPGENTTAETVITEADGKQTKIHEMTITDIFRDLSFVRETKDTEYPDGTTESIDQSTYSNGEYVIFTELKDADGNYIERTQKGKGIWGEDIRYRNRVIKGDEETETMEEKELTMHPDGSAYVHELKTETGNGTVTYSAGYDVKGEEATLLYMKNLSGEIKIPTFLEGADGQFYTVTEIGEEAFSGDESLVSVDCGIELKRILSGAFKGCKNLKVIDIPAKTEFGEGSLSGTSKSLKIYVSGTKKDVKAVKKQLEKAGNKKAKVKRR